MSNNLETNRTPAFEYLLTARYGSTAVLHEAAGQLYPGEVVSLIGLSGSGKTTLSLALLRLLQYRGGTIEGSIRLQGRELMSLSQREMRRVRGKQIGYVPQSPASALNPRMRVRGLLEETWRAHSALHPEPRFFEQLLESVCLPYDPDFQKRFAGGLSTGQGQRLLIALGILHRPQVLLADEPTSALDPITQNQILVLLGDLAARHNMAMLFISHDLRAVASCSSRVEILHKGRIVESGPPAEIFGNPAHEFTKDLVRAVSAFPNGHSTNRVSLHQPDRWPQQAS